MLSSQALRTSIRINWLSVLRRLSHIPTWRWGAQLALASGLTAGPTFKRVLENLPAGGAGKGPGAEAFAAYVRSEIEKWSRVVRDAKLALD